MGGVMKRLFLLCIALASLHTMAQGQEIDFDFWFTGGTLRIDCLREGTADHDTVWVARWVDRKADWHGSRKHLIDPIDNGDYRVVVSDVASGRELYTRGYSSLFREYRDTPEGHSVKATFEETLLVPMPKNPVVVTLRKRVDGNRNVDATVAYYDPHLTPTITSGTGVCGEVGEVHGDPSGKLDVAFVMQGFENSTDKEYRGACRRMMNALFGKEPFRGHRDKFNTYFVRADAGVEYNTFGADRYAMTFKLWQLHDALGTTPADHIIIVINNEKYGGGAIYNFYSVSSLHKMAENVLPHELGHGIGGLADEYVDEDLSYADLHRTAFEPLEPNITNLVDFDSKWKRLLRRGTPVPTPDNPDVPRNECGPLGAYEGAGYSSKGVYRPAMHCMMRDYAPFCPVCLRHLIKVINLYTE